MPNLINIIKEKDHLLPVSAGLTIGIMLFFFVLAQVFSFTTLKNEEPALDEQMEVHEVVKLKFPEPKIITPAPRVRVNRRHQVFRRSKVPVQRKQLVQEARDAAMVNSILQGFDKDKFLSNKSSAAKRGTLHRAHQNNAGIRTNVNRQLSTVSEFDLSTNVTSTPNSALVGRRSAAGGTQSMEIGIGGSGSFGNGLGGSDLNGAGFGSDLMGRGTLRTTRGGHGDGTGGTQISLPSGGGNGDQALDLHALIKWMKAHPGTIPKLVAHDMGHRNADLSSAVPFRLQGKNFQLYLSCNENEMLLRICLIDGNEFTLLKDNGIKETSNYLTLGNVVRERGQIRSLISSRRAPANHADQFYQIFWSWWMGQQ